MNELEQKRKRIETAVKVAGALVVGFFVAPFIYVALGGLIGLIVAAAISVTAINFTPWYAAKLANWRLKAIKAEAAKNPIETLQNDYNRRQQDLNKFGDAIRSFMTEVSQFADKLVGFSKQYPAEAQKFADNLRKMKQLLSIRQEKYKGAKNNLDDYELEIQKASAIWDMGQAAAIMNKAAGMSDEDFFAKIQVETALDSVQKNLNSAFADLEFSLIDEEKAPSAASLDKAGVYDTTTPATTSTKRQRIVES